MQALSHKWRIGTAAGHIDCAEVSLCCGAYAPHRHTRFVIAQPISGLKRFRYRGEGHLAGPGAVVVLHPDEKHDGADHEGVGLVYRAAYIGMPLVRAVLGARAVPEPADPVLVDEGLAACTQTLLNIDAGSSEPLAVVDASRALVERMAVIFGARLSAVRLDRRTIGRIELVMNSILDRPLKLHDLEVETGLDRWSLSRGFREAYGVSLYQYHLGLRLSRSQALLQQGASALDAALECGFADQSHFGRHFKRTFGLSPAVWRGALA